jgi:hypothetical protein
MTRLALDAALLPLLEYWRSKLQGRRLPSLEDIDLGDIPALAAHVQIVENAAGRFRYARVGAAITEAYGTNPTGAYVDEYLPQDRRVLAWRNYAMVSELRSPLVTRCTFHLPGGFVAKTNRLLLPLIGEHGRVGNVLVGLSLSEAPRGRALRLASTGSVDDGAYALELLSAMPYFEPVPAPVRPALVVMP